MDFIETDRNAYRTDPAPRPRFCSASFWVGLATGGVFGSALGAFVLVVTR